MLKITEEQKRPFYQSGYFKNYKFAFRDVGLTIDNETLHQESVTIKESICDDEDLQLGGCVASSCEFEVSEILDTDIAGLEFTATIEARDASDNIISSVPMGVYRVFSAKLVNDTDYKKVVAYDALYDAGVDVSNWYNNLFPVLATQRVYVTGALEDVWKHGEYSIDSSGNAEPSKLGVSADENQGMTYLDTSTGKLYQSISVNTGQEEEVYQWTEVYQCEKNYRDEEIYKKVTVKEMRESLLKHLGILYEVQDLPNDTMLVEKTVEPSEGSLTGTSIMKYLCEVNGGFGRINRNGKFEVLILGSMGLYPEETLYPEEDLYPMSGSENYEYFGMSDEEERPEFKNTTYEEYIVYSPTCITIKGDSDDYGTTVGDNTSNPYVLSGNILLYGKGVESLQEVGKNILEYLQYVSYKPNTTTLQGLPYMEVGDMYSLDKQNDSVDSYIFSRTLSGVQALSDEYVSKGSEKRTNDPSVNSEITQLQGRTLKIKKDLDVYSIEMTNIAKNTSTKFEQTDSTIVLKVDNNGNLSQVELSGDPNEGTVFKVTSNNIELSADDVLNLLSGGTIDIQAGDGITISSPNFTLSKEAINIITDNFTLDENGSVIANDITITGGKLQIKAKEDIPYIEMKLEDENSEESVSAGMSPSGSFNTGVSSTWEERSSSGLLTYYRTLVSTENKNGSWASKVVKQYRISDKDTWSTETEYPEATIKYVALSGEKISTFTSSKNSSYFQCDVPFFTEIDLMNDTDTKFTLADGFTSNSDYWNYFKMVGAMVQLCIDVRGTLAKSAWTTVAKFNHQASFAGINLTPKGSDTTNTSILYPIVTSRTGSGNNAVARLVIKQMEVGGIKFDEYYTEVQVYQYGDTDATWAQINMTYCIDVSTLTE